MRLTYVARSFLDYRIPVYQELNRLCNGNFTLIYNGDLVPERVKNKAKAILGPNAIELHNETKLNFGKNTDMSSSSFSITYQKDLIKTIRSTDPDVLLSDGFGRWTYANLFVRAFNCKGIKHVMCYERTKHTERNAGTISKLYRKFSCHLIDAIDCNGILTEQYVRSLGFHKKLTFGHMAADTDGMAKNCDSATQPQVDSLKQKYGVNGTLYLYVGRLIALKGLKEMLHAWNDANLSDSTLMLVGEGNERPLLESIINEHNLSNVILTGAIDYDSLGVFYKAADIFIIPTLQDNWSLVVPEAMACGLPILCSIYNGCHPELVHPENGWTFNPLDHTDFIETLKESDKHKANFKTMGLASKEIVKNHTPANAAKGIYEACLYVTSKN